MAVGVATAADVGVDPAIDVDPAVGNACAVGVNAPVGDDLPLTDEPVLLVEGLLLDTGVLPAVVPGLPAVLVALADATELVGPGVAVDVAAATSADLCFAWLKIDRLV